MTEATTRAPRRPANDNYRPQPYTGDGLEVVRNISTADISHTVLRDVAKWHEHPRFRRDPRHVAIAAAIRAVA